MWTACTHKTFRDFTFRRDDERLVWKCSHCSKQALWSEGWGYYGSVECKKCWCAAIEFVWCSTACRDELKRNGAALKERPPEPPVPKRSRRAPSPRVWAPCSVGSTCQAAGTRGADGVYEVASNKNAAAVALGRLGGAKGGKARAAKLSPEERSEISRKAARARWKPRGA